MDFRREDLPKCYQSLNVAEILKRIEDISDNFMRHPGQDLDEFLGDAEEILDLVWVLRTSLGIPTPEDNFRA